MKFETFSSGLSLRRQANPENRLGVARVELFYPAAILTNGTVPIDTPGVGSQEDQSRLRAGHGAKNMAVVRHFALNLVRKAGDKRSIKRRRKRASWDPQYLLQIPAAASVLTWTRCPDLSVAFGVVRFS